jgi:exopolysaccharide biosynthesis operon protein EpsL
MPQPGGAPFPGGISQPASTQGSMARDAEAPALQFRVLAGIEHETNALRVPSAANPVSDEVGIVGVGLKANRRYGLQRIRADVEANTYRYRKQSDLNYNTINYALAWDWQFTPAFHGIVSADRKQYRVVTTDPVALVNRVGRRTERAETAEGIYDLGAAWRLLAGVAHTESSSNQPSPWDASPSVRSARVGAGYELPSGASIFARFRRGDGEYQDPLAAGSASEFKENEAELVGKWPVTGKTFVEGRLGHIKREHSAAPLRDFSGMVGSAFVRWEITGKTRLSAGVGRDLSATGLAVGGHVQQNRFYIGPVWQATAQIAVNARYDRVSRDWKDVPAGSPEVGQRERVQLLSAGLDWEPRRYLTVSTYVRGERLKSNVTAGYRSTTVGAAVKAYF